MKNNKLRNGLIAAGIAVLAGVLVLSVSVAMGDAPGYAPPSAAGVSPVFSDIEVQGVINRTGGAVSIGDVDPGLIALFGLSDGDLVINDTVFAEGIISSGGDTWVGGDLNFNSSLGAIKSPNGNTISIDENLTVNGNISATGGGSISTTGTVTTGSIALNGSLTGGNINSDSVISNGNISAGGNVTATGSISSLSSTGSIDIYGTITNTRATTIKKSTTEYPVKIDDDLIITGKFGSYYNISTNTAGGRWIGGAYTSCPSEDTLVSCGGVTNTGALNYINSSVNTCFVTSSDGGATGVTAYARCFDGDSL